MAIDGGDPGDGRMPDHPTTAETSRRLASAAGRLSRALCSMAALSAADGAALMLAGEANGLHAVGGSTADGLELEYAQEFERAGPTRESVAADHPVAVDDLADGAGPAYAQPARRAAPVRAVLSVPVRLDGTVIGALDFYRRRPGTWTGGQIALGEHLADTAADLVARLAAHPEAHDHGRP
ncbi:GAF domain-containing protein [Actinomadura chokoriensis]|uniref:GAF domain-containing protein n=1 Tax=Actinomadura chokoriensis TaxID=454156 RepID=UPI0031F8242B